MAAPNSEHDARSCRRRAHGKADLASARPDRRAAGTAGPPGWRPQWTNGNGMRAQRLCPAAVRAPGRQPDRPQHAGRRRSADDHRRIRAQGYTSVTVQSLTG
jgi:hypothetical protein